MKLEDTISLMTSDDYKEKMERAIEICGDFYDSDGNYIGKYDPECIPLELRKVN